MSNNFLNLRQKSFTEYAKYLYELSKYDPKKYKTYITKGKRDRQKYVKDKGYDQFVYVDKPEQSFESAYVNGDYIDWEGLHNLIDEEFNKQFDDGLLKHKTTPDPTVYGNYHINLYTYPIFGDYYPMTGHSELRGPRGFKVDKTMEDKDYNLLFNNCSDATYKALRDIFGNEFDTTTSWEAPKRPIITPKLVESLARKIPGAKYYQDNGYTTVSIPIKSEWLFDRLRYSTGLGYYYENGGSKKDPDKVPCLRKENYHNYNTDDKF